MQLSNRTQLFVSSHLLLAANACSASLSPQSLAQGPKPTVSVLAHCCSTLWVQLHATQLHPSPRLSSLTLWVQLHATQLHPSPRLSSDLSPSRSGSDRTLLALVSCSAARRRSDSAAATVGPFPLPPTNLHRPAISSPPPPDIVSLLTPRRFPSRLVMRCSSPAPHLAPPCYPIYIYTSLVAKYVLFCVAYALVCAGRAVVYVHANDREVDARSPIGEAGSQRTHKKQVCAKLHTLP